MTPASGPAVNNGSVTFTVKQGVTTIGAATTDNTVVAGAASVSYLLPAGTNAGPYTIEAAYTPGAGFNASSGTGTLTINKRNTLTTVSSSLNPSTFGESVSFTATVVGTGAGAGNPSGGSVQFKIDGANFGAPVALAGWISEQRFNQHADRRQSHGRSSLYFCRHKLQRQQRPARRWSNSQQAQHADDSLIEPESINLRRKRELHGNCCWHRRWRW